MTKCKVPGKESGTGWVLAKYIFYPLFSPVTGEALTSIKCSLGEARLCQEKEWVGLKVRRRVGEALASRCVQQLGQLPGGLSLGPGPSWSPSERGMARKEEVFISLLNGPYSLLRNGG